MGSYVIASDKGAWQSYKVMDIQEIASSSLLAMTGSFSSIFSAPLRLSGEKI